MNEQKDIWVNGEDLKHEYAYFTFNNIAGKANPQGLKKTKIFYL